MWRLFWAPPSVVEVSVTETTVVITPLITHTSISGTTVNFDLSAQTLGAAGEAKFTVTVNSAAQEYISSLVTTRTYPETTLWLSFGSTQTAFILTGTGVTEITIPSQYNLVTVKGVETVDPAGITTTLSVEGSTNVIVQIPGTTASLEVSGFTTEFTAVTTTISESGATKYCGDQTLAEGDAGNTCVMGTTFTIDVPGAFCWENIAGTGIIEQLFLLSKTYMSK